MTLLKLYGKKTYYLSYNTKDNKINYTNWSLNI